MKTFNVSLWFVFFQQQITSFQTEKNRLSLTLEERTEQERAEQTKTLERLEQELEIRGKAEAAAAEAERQRKVLAVDLKDIRQKYERLLQEHNTLADEVLYHAPCCCCSIQIYKSVSYQIVLLLIIWLRHNLAFWILRVVNKT